MAGCTDMCMPVFDKPAAIVESQIAYMLARGEAALSAAQASIEGLGGVTFPNEAQPPPIEGGDPVSIGEPEVTPPEAEVQGDIPGFTKPTLLTSLLEYISDVDVPDPGTFDPPVAINFPDPPAPLDTSGLPTKPVLAFPDVPSSPDVTVPVMDQMLEIVLPTAEEVTIPSISLEVPLFDREDPTMVLDWVEPTYSPTVRNEVVAEIKAMLAGGHAMPASVEAALFNSGVDREVKITEQQVREVYADFASKGFSLPPGMLADTVRKVREDGELRLSTLNREIYTKAAEWAIENLRQAVAHGIAMEGQLIELFLAHAQRVFEAARFRAEADVNVYNAVAGAFNARAQAINAYVAVFNAQVQAELSKLQKYELLIKAEGLKTEVNSQVVETYKAKVQAMGERVKAFAALIDAVRAEGEMEKTRMEAYKEEVQAYVAKINADKVRFDAYESQARVEASKSSIIESASRGFAATVEAQTTRANARVGVVQARADALRAAADVYQADVAGEREKIQAALARVQATAETLRTRLQAWSEGSRAKTAFLGTEAQVAIENSKNALMKSDMAGRRYDAAMLRSLEQAKIQAETMANAAQAAAQLAAGAMSAIHVQASLSGSGSASGSEVHTYDHGQV